MAQPQNVKYSSNINLQPPPPLSFEGNLERNFKTWIRHVELYLIANECQKKPSRTKVAILLSLLGEEGLDKYETFDLDAEAKQDYDKVKLALANYCVPKTNETISRHIFFTRNQKNETFDEYLVEIKKLANKCNFGDLKDSLIRDKIICGVNCPKLKDRLLREEGLNLEKCIYICRLAEMTQQNLSQLNVQEINVDKIDNSSKKKPEKFKCNSCGYEHTARNCPAYNKTCYQCGKLHHFASVCKNKNQRRVNMIQDNNKEEYILGAIDVDNWTLEVNFTDYNKKCLLKLDTGAGCNVISKNTLKKLGIPINLKQSQAILKNYNNTIIKLEGTINLRCDINNESVLLKFHVVDCNSVPLIGLPTIKRLNIIKPVCHIDKDSILNQYPSLFSGVGEIKDYVYDFKLIPNYTGKVIPCRPVPLKLLDTYKKELLDMEKNKIICKIEEPTEFVNAVVIVRKSDNSLRVCLDPQYLNSCLLREHYKLPTFEEISGKMANAKVFSKLDCSKAFHQIKLSESSSKLTTFQTPFGRYRFLRMPYGVKVASEVYHKQFSRLFEGLPNVEIFIDDLIIWADNKKNHDKTLHLVLKIALENNITFNSEKCIIGTNSLKFLGHKFTDKGIYMDEDKIESIVKMEKPSDINGIQRLLGIITYISKFIPNFSDVTSPLRILLKKDKSWEWGNEQEECFNKIKNYLITKPVLQYYDPNLPCLLSVDASGSGVGAVLLQNGLPVAYASKAFTQTQKAWAQIEKEMYAIVFACEKFHFYIMGRTVSIENDHKPLIPIMKKPLAEIPIRLQKMRLRLQHYDIVLSYKPGKLLLLADYLSRNHLKQECKEDDYFDCSVLLINLKEKMSIQRYEQFLKETEKDEELNLLKKYILNGWPQSNKDLPDILKPYHTFHTDLHLIDGLIFKNDCLIVPKVLQLEMLKKLHYSHLGIEKTKNRARELLFWISMSKHIETFIQNCSTCIKFSKSNTKETLIPHMIPNVPWKKLGVDIFHLYSRDYILVIDYFSKYVEVIQLQSLTADCIVKSLKQCFSRFGIPIEVHSDGGPQFQSSTFKEFSKKWDFKHIISSAYYPKSNGMVERHIQTIKNILKKCYEDKRDPYLALLEYRNTPISNEIGSPNKILIGHNVRGMLPLELNNRSESYDTIKKKLQKRQTIQKGYYDRHTNQLKSFSIGDKVVLKNHQTNVFDKPGIVTEIVDKPRSYNILTETGKITNRNRVDIKRNSKDYVFKKEEDMIDSETKNESSQLSLSKENLNLESKDNVENMQNDNQLTLTNECNNHQTPLVMSRSGRIVKPPSYLKDYES